jgi:hypothetical protein
MGDETVTYKVLVGTPAVNRPLGRPRRKWEDNIKMDLLKMVGGGRYWSDLAQYRDR